MNRFNQSWELAKQSWTVMRSHPSLAIFPIFSGIVSLLVTISFMLPFIMSSIVPYLQHMNTPGSLSGQHVNQAHFNPVYYAVLFCYYVVSYFVVVFFNVGLIHCASKVLNNEPTSVSDGIRAATQRIVPILGWSLVGATVGTILRAIADNVNWVGQLVVAIFGAGWNIITFFVVPTLALEGVGPIDAIKTSFDTIKKTWGETVIGNIGVSFAIGMLCVVPIPIFIAACFTKSVWLILGMLSMSVLYWLSLSIIGSCLSGIYTTAVFHYARTGNVPSVFTADQIQMAFLNKEPNKATGYIRNKLGR